LVEKIEVVISVFSQNCKAIYGIGVTRHVQESIYFCTSAAKWNSVPLAFQLAQPLAFALAEFNCEQ
jgi:hypothetical protein